MNIFQIFDETFLTVFEGMLARVCIESNSRGNVQYTHCIRSIIISNSLL